MTEVESQHRICNFTRTNKPVHFNSSSSRLHSSSRPPSNVGMSLISGGKISPQSAFQSGTVPDSTASFMRGGQTSPQNSFQGGTAQDSTTATPLHSQHEAPFLRTNNGDDENIVLQIVTEADANKQIKVMIKSASGQDFSQLHPYHDESEIISNASAFMSHSMEESRLGESLSGVANLSAWSKSGRIDRLESGSGPLVALSTTSMQLGRDQLLIEGRVKPSLPLSAQRGRQQQRPASSASIRNRTQEEEGQRSLTALSDLELKQLRIARSKMQMRKELLQPTRVIFDASEKVIVRVLARCLVQPLKLR